MLNSIEIDGITYKVNITEIGEFYSVVDGTKLSSDTFQGLREKLIKATKRARAKCSIAFYSQKGDVLKPGKITGIHSANGNFLVTWQDGTKEQVSPWGDNWYIITDDAVLAEGNSLLGDLAKARSNWKEFTKKTEKSTQYMRGLIAQACGVEEEEE